MLDELAFMRRRELPIWIIYFHVLEKIAPSHSHIRLFSEITYSVMHFLTACFRLWDNVYNIFQSKISLGCFVSVMWSHFVCCILVDDRVWNQHLSTAGSPELLKSNGVFPKGIPICQGTKTQDKHYATAIFSKTVTILKLFTIMVAILSWSMDLGWQFTSERHILLSSPP